jgi:hypothetical protein
MNPKEHPGGVLSWPREVTERCARADSVSTRRASPISIASAESNDCEGVDFKATLLAIAEHSRSWITTLDYAPELPKSFDVLNECRRSADSISG